MILPDEKLVVVGSTVTTKETLLKYQVMYGYPKSGTVRPVTAEEGNAFRAEMDRIAKEYP